MMNSVVSFIGKILEKLPGPAKVPEQSLSLSVVLGGFGILLLVVIASIAYSNYSIAEKHKEELLERYGSAIAESDFRIGELDIEGQAIGYESLRLEPQIDISRAHQGELEDILSGLHADASDTRNDINDLKNKITQIQTQYPQIDSKISGVKSEIARIKKELK